MCSGLVLLWIVLLAAILAVPHLYPSPTYGDDLIRNTIRLALLYYAIAASLMLVLRREEWTAAAGRSGLARSCWTLSWAAYLVHLGMAFHYAHHWSHTEAMAHTRAVSGVGEGVYVSYLFTWVWTADVAWWWLRPARYAARSRRVDGLLHGFMAFVIFNATVVYETGPIRWAGCALFAELAVLLAWRQASKERESAVE